MLDEILDTFDNDMNWTGTATRQDVHRFGIWHQTFHCWVMHRLAGEDFLILQRRHRTKDTNPNKLGVSCAGHLEAGETPMDGVRELREELGLQVDSQQLNPVGLFKYSGSEDDVVDKEFCHVYFLIQEGLSLTDYQPAIGEVSGLYLVRVVDLQKMCRAMVEYVPVSGFEMDDHGVKSDQTLQVSLNDLVEYPTSYYELLFEKLGS